MNDGVFEIMGSTALSSFHLQRNPVHFFFKWFNDPEIYRFLGDRELISYTMTNAENHIKAIQTDSLLVVAKKENAWIPIGYVRLVMRPRHKVANFTIAIGDKNFWGVGHGKRATLLTLRYGFEKLNLYAIHLVVSVSNERAVRLYESTGFSRCGLRHNARQEEGKRVDEILMEYTKEMYYDRR